MKDGKAPAFLGRECLSAAELAGLPGLPGTTRAIQMRAHSERWQSRPRAGRGGGREYYRSSLPRETREHLARLELESAPPVVIPDLDRAGTFYKECPPDAGASLAGVAPKNLARAQARLALLAAIHDYATAANLSLRQAIHSFCPAYSAGHIAPDHPARALVRRLDAATVYRWLAAQRKAGTAGLAPKYRPSRRNAIDLQPDLREFLLGMLRDYPHTSSTLLMRGLKARFKADVIPSKRALQRWLSGWKAEHQQLFLAVRNPDAWRSKYRAAGGDAGEMVERLNQRWELDSTPADVILADGKRHAIIGVIDVYSRRLKLQVSRTSRGTAIAALVRRALLDWGVPETAVTDNGQDYVSLYLRAAWQDLGVQHVICPPFSPERKPFIERALGRFSHDLVELLPGYIGHSVAQRKDIEARRSFADRLTRRGGEPVVLSLTAEQLQSICDQWTDSVYAREPHQGLDGRSPFEAATQWTAPRRRIQDERALDVLLAELAGERVIGKKGIRVDGGVYDAPELGGREGERAIVRLDEADLGRVYVYAATTGAFICVAQDPARTGVSRREIAIERRRRQSAVLSAGKRALAEASRRSNTAGIAAEILAARQADAQGVVAFPGRAEQHVTEALQAAADAAAAADALSRPAVTPVVDLELHRRLVAETTAEPQIEETPDDRARFAIELIEGERTATPAQAAWLEGYQKTDEFKGRWFVYSDLGPWWIRKPRVGGAQQAASQDHKDPAP